MASDNASVGTARTRYYLCVTCGRLRPDDRFGDGNCTCTDCYDDGIGHVRYRRADDGDGWLKANGGEADAE